ncbi:hypothetical protein CKO28_03110 [Rhodovibrio sodomensis]|uniref:Uncharacterized protein n=1 Tax=Rhodovibrio sodomensis TaxID=1088 RepID=A0ABS1D9D8_9PROT|nr:hypothetical protein [Rhodovibrio sodomensis]MBK1667033.1 hypothetical protein [Rhodovibrio sodomensis]
MIAVLTGAMLLAAAISQRWLDRLPGPLQIALVLAAFVLPASFTGRSAYEFVYAHKAGGIEISTAEACDQAAERVVTSRSDAAEVRRVLRTCGTETVLAHAIATENARIARMVARAGRRW